MGLHIPGAPLILAYCMLSSVVGWMWEHNKPEGRWTKEEWPVEPSQEDISAERAVAEAQRVAGLFGHRPVGEWETSLLFDYGSLAREWRLECESCLVCVNAKSGEFADFVCYDMGDIEALVSKTREDAIPREKAVDAALGMARQLGVKLERDKLIVEYKDGGGERPNDLLFANWVIRQVYEVGGVETRYPTVRIHVAALDGAVNFFCQWHSVDGVNIEQWPMTRPEALRAIETTLPALDMSGMKEIGLKIVNPRVACMAYEANEPVLCWIWEDPRPGRTLFVNAKSGRVHVIDPYGYGPTHPFALLLGRLVTGQL